MCLRTLELFSVFIGFIFMFLYLYKHTSHYPPRKRSDRPHTTKCRARIYSYTTYNTQTSHAASVSSAVPRRAGLYRAGDALFAIQRCASCISAGQPFNPGSCQCGSVLSTDWSSSYKSLSTLPNKSHFPGTSGRIFATPPSKR